jgi:hypothetical protein
MLKIILDDLKAQFGQKVLLTPEDIAEIINMSVGEQANKRSQGRFPIPYNKDSGRIRISIYDLAEYLSNCCNQHCKQEIKQTRVVLSRIDKKAIKGHLQGNWWLFRCNPIISIIRKSILDFQLPNKNLQNSVNKF